jgi:mono/diheme cytochrome c family protein
MTQSSLRTTVVLIIIAVVGAGALGALAYARRQRPTPAMRGYAVAQSLGCFGCHGPAGTGGIPNLGAEEGEIPAWDGGTSMMYVKNEQEIREWILDGHPKRLAKSDSNGTGHDSYRGDAASKPPPVEMPAFRGVVSNDELEDLVAYYKAVAVFDPMPESVRKGYGVARRSGCFGCHGPGGRVGLTNPRSLKGYIPPWHGSDFAELVRNEAELREWIRNGAIARVESNPVARFFTHRQAIQMPAYEDLLDPGDIDHLVAYIDWLQSHTR